MSSLRLLGIRWESVLGLWISSMKHHTCYCGINYPCEFCGTPDAYICPTVNGDEDGNLCPECHRRECGAMRDFDTLEERDGDR